MLIYVNPRHPRIDKLERYFHGLLTGTRLSETEEHILTCRECRGRIRSLACYHAVLQEDLQHVQAEIHATEDGLIYNWVEVLKTGRYKARHRGFLLDGGDEFDTERQAWAYLRRSFSEMFPGHECRKQCSIRDGGNSGFDRAC